MTLSGWTYGITFTSDRLAAAYLKLFECIVTNCFKISEQYTLILAQSKYTNTILKFPTVAKTNVPYQLFNIQYVTY